VWSRSLGNSRRVTADTYTHVLFNERELDYDAMLGLN
jgi:hypothetical protein